MLGDPANDAPGAFWAADESAAADRLSAILREEGATTLVV